MRTIIVVEYDLNWPLEFERLKAVYQRHLADFTVDIEHVGSTSVPGLAAKPVIDIDIIVPDQTTVAPVIEQLTELGYVHLGDLGIQGREAFERASGAVPYGDERSDWPAHNLYVCPRGIVSLENHLRFRAYLRTHPKAVTEYARIKRELAAQFPHDIDAYVDGKTDFITRILAEVGISDTDVADITEQNQKRD